MAVALLSGLMWRHGRNDTYREIQPRRLPANNVSHTLV